MSKFTQFLQGALSEDNNHPSSTRLNVFISIISLVPAIMFTLVYTTIFYKDLVPSVLITVVSFVAAVLGIKAYAKTTEAKGNDDEKVEGKP